MSVPHTKDWFSGIANLRGHLHGVVDLAQFFRLTSRSTLNRDHAWLVAFNHSLQVNCALLIDQLLGLRHADQMQLQVKNQQKTPAFIGENYRDENNRLWRELDLLALSKETAFLRIAS
jgi:twitching motility protein PilI